MRDRAELLDELKIDRSAETPRAGLSPGIAIVLTLFAAAAGAAATWYLAPRQVVAEAKPLVSAKRAPSPVPAEAPPAPTRTAAVDEDRRILNASGYITARRIATVSSQITGLITEVNVEEGMVVERGQVLARLDSAIVSVDLELEKARMAAALASIEGTRVSLAEAERVYRRAQSLRERNLTSDADLTRSTANRDNLKANLTRAEADIRVSKLVIARQEEQLQDHTIRAPFAGVVTVKNAQTGEIVSPGSAGGGFTRTGICTIVDMNSLEIEVDVNEAFIGRVFEAQKVEANLDAYPDWDIPASVIAIIPTADRAKATVRVRIGINVSDERILPDMGVKVAFLQD
ncbi:MAG: efflux RND transporter periplasmic adaptor subunit [Gammaproteobacteria bacterium]